MNTRDDRGACDLDRRSRPEQELSPGAHLVSTRTGYSHHGIYVGGGRVVHYRGFERGLRIGPIETASIEQFARGRPLRVLEAGAPHFEASVIVQRAMSRIGEDRYHVFTNNCEHFCEWCVHAEQRSYQVDRLFRWLIAPLRLARGGRDRAMQVCALIASGLSSLSLQVEESIHELRGTSRSHCRRCRGHWACGFPSRWLRRPRGMRTRSTCN